VKNYETSKSSFDWLTVVVVSSSSQRSRPISSARSKRLLVPGGVHSGHTQDRSVSSTQPRHGPVPVARRDNEERPRRHVAVVRVPEATRFRCEALREAHRLVVMRQQTAFRLGYREQVSKPSLYEYSGLCCTLMYLTQSVYTRLVLVLRFIALRCGCGALPGAECNSCLL